MSSGDECYGYRFSVVGCLGVSFRGMFILVGLALMGVDRGDVFVGVCFWVFRIYTAPLVVLPVSPVSVRLVQRFGF